MNWLLRFVKISQKSHISINTFNTKYRVIKNDCRGFNLVLQMQPHVIPFFGVTSRIMFMFLLFPQLSRNWKYESEPPLKPSQLTCYKQFGTNSIIVLMFVEGQRAHMWSTYKVCNKTCSSVIKKKKKYIYFYLKCIVYDKLLKHRQSFPITLYLTL
jgi:hypothetical protein